jgi:pantothenate synthetase
MRDHSHEGTDMDNEMMMGEEAETYPCLMICMKPDGTAMVSRQDMPPPEDSQEAASLDEAFEIARQMAEQPDEGMEDEAMASAQAGYNKRKPQGMMDAPNPEGVFGE